MKTSPPVTADVLIVGAGPTGLTLANLLGGMGVQTLLVERNEGTVEEPRAVSIDDESMRTVQAAGLVDRVEPIISRGYGSIYHGPGGKVFASVMPTSQEYGFDKRNAFQQPELEAVLRNGLARYGCIKTFFRNELVAFSQSESGVTACLRGADGQESEVTARYLVGCDGGRSSVRKALGLEMEGGTFKEPWLIVDLVQTENRSRHTEVFCDPERPCISLPGPNLIRRYEFLLHDDEDREAATAEPFVRSLLARVGPDAKARLRRVQVYTFHARVAATWRQGSVLLAGDAAHLTPPFAGQGMNSGLRDAHNLAWKLSEALRTDKADALLDSYEAERKPHAQAMIDLALRMGRVMMPKSRLQAWLVRAGFWALGLYPPARDYFAHMRYKPKPKFTRGLVWPDKAGPGADVAGRMLPQPLVETPQRSRAMLDDILPDQPVFLVFDARPEFALPDHIRARANALGAAVVGLTPEGVNPLHADFPIVRDVSGLLAVAPFADCVGHVLLLRRDRYVAALRPVERAEELLPLLAAIAPGGLSRSDQMTYAANSDNNRQIPTEHVVLEESPNEC